MNPERERDGPNGETIRNIRDFYIILVGIAIGYFIGVAVNYGTPNHINGNITASPITIVKWIGHALLKEGPSVDIDSPVRSVGLIVASIIAMILYAKGLGSYDPFLKRKNPISVTVEMFYVVAFIVSPLFLLEAFSPSLALTDYPKTEVWIEIISLALGISIPVIFFNRTRKGKNLAALPKR